ncbi:TauD/TfdA family dioxygenase [Burkholderia vietnamiensis]|uniref:TauD/TfdA family dioxygenase n=1 Tax=Burkholderia vietnamiensis TaxID=60552 RepID=UPI000757A0CC|nr:TauD/TfdA family dioxygenase [Burkholderia vietnamiensis]KVE65944.1 taurine catabolism dioxygenase TauD [Burkholderia vietnamiensis]
MKSTFEFSDREKSDLSTALRKLDKSPYQDYSGFHRGIGALVENGSIPTFFLNVCETIRNERTGQKRYAHLLRNVPLDDTIPVFDQNDPVQDKYEKKKSYVGEALLELFAQLTRTPLLAYQTRNNGDFFHDVYAHKKYSQTQTQKTDGELFFHNDRTAHPVRADYLSLLGMRCSDANRIYTGFLDGRALLDHISEAHQAMLREPHFITPYDEYSRDSNLNQTVSDRHVILENAHSFRYYDTRTTYAPGAPIDAIDALLSLKNAIVKANKERVQIRTGDLFSFANQDALHNRELIEVNDHEDALKRWLLKTYSFRDNESMHRFDHYFAEQPGLVRESAALA